ncbi:MAG: alpha/beta fold hydrolase [Gammaproteobacteria bacterium]|jgi:dipeptidyl aminopeptidase/acylaminoacyl peptidase|nr:alpha/beta fold hydrolase [Gammaproteobacteria bacterium]MDP7041040.1 alpha/beta fold hydrolase [Gammaproteobacteria bacterium]
MSYKDGQPVPAIVLPHGGPMARAYGGFDWLVQFLANRGYVVLQPNFRGSSGYGFQFEMQAVQNWGERMQDDLADAANWMIDQELAIPGKICIVGRSYGGYASLMAAAKQQDTFSCAASINGVSDQWEVWASARRYMSKEIIRKQLGTNKEDLIARSPISYTKTIDIPVLLIHGEKDRIVPVTHSRRMDKALRKAGKQVKYVELDNGNHSLSIEQNRIETLRLLEEFLLANLGKTT